MRGRIPRLGAVAATAVLLGATVGWSGVGAQPDEDAAQRAAAEITEARDRANEAAAAYAEADFAIEALEEEAAALAQQNAELQVEVEALRAQVEQIAVSRLIGSGSTGIPVLTGYQDPSEQLQTAVLVDAATESSAESMDDFEAARTALEENQREVAANQAELDDQQERFAELREAAEAEVVELQQIEAQRLEDERVRLILEAQQREEQRRRDEEAAREQQAAAALAAQQAAQQQADAAASAAAQQQAADQQAARQSAEQQTPPASGDGPAVTAGAAPVPEGGGDDDDGDTAPVVIVEPPPPPPSRSGILCPVRGTAYTDTWGAARSGGRTHQGVDMITNTGNPIYAVVSGSVQFKQNSLGGNAVWLNGDNGDRYYYAHLSRYEGSSRTVAAGEVIGYVGDTGNARGTPHLHFEVHPGGGAAVRPYPYVRDAGC